MIPLLGKSRRYDPDHGYAAVGRCIYCGTDQGLTREHIIPLGLRGRFEIGCQPCSVLSNALASFRLSVSKPSVNQP